MDRSGSFRAEAYRFTNSVSEPTPSRRDFYKIWLVENRGILGHGNCMVDLSQPALVFLHPLVSYTFVPIDQERSGHWCIFTSEFISGAPRFVHLQNATLFHPDHA